MKRILLICAALVLVVSGVAAVSAYEAHVVNVKATVENAIAVTETELDFGTVFPEEWLSLHFDVIFSDSWSDQTRVDSVDFEVWAEDKEIPDSSPIAYYPWLGDVMFIEMNGTRGYIGAAIASPLHAQPALDGNDNPIVGTLTTATNESYTIYVWIDVPVFADFYNPLTDVPDKPRASWADTLADVGAGDPTMILPSGTPQGYVMGVDLKIQVVNIYLD